LKDFKFNMEAFRNWAHESECLNSLGSIFTTSLTMGFVSGRIPVFLNAAELRIAEFRWRERCS
jgi:hypothetical protein